MIVSDVIAAARDAGTELSASIRFERTGERERLTFWFDGIEPGAVAATGDPFMPLAIIAFWVGEDLRIETPVSPLLRRNVVRIVELLAPAGPGRVPRIVAPELATQACGAGAGLFFSAGVDSWFELLRDRASITDLVFVRELAMNHEDPSLEAELVPVLRRVAAETRTRFVYGRTNLRFIAKPRVRSMYSFQAASHACVAHALGPAIGTWTIAGSHMGRFAHDVTDPEHPATRELWESESVRIVPRGADLARSAKVREIAASPLALETLHVCNARHGSNCGRCRKCVQAQLYLLACGALGRSVTVSHDVDFDRIRRCYVDDHGLDLTDDVVGALEEAGADPRIMAAYRSAVRRSVPMVKLAKASDRLGRQVPWLAPVLRLGGRVLGAR